MTPLDDASTDAAQQDHRGLGLVTAFLPAPQFRPAADRARRRRAHWTGPGAESSRRQGPPWSRATDLLAAPSRNRVSEPVQRAGPIASTIGASSEVAVTARVAQLASGTHVTRPGRVGRLRYDPERVAAVGLCAGVDDRADPGPAGRRAGHGSLLCAPGCGHRALQAGCIDRRLRELCRSARVSGRELVQRCIAAASWDRLHPGCWEFAVNAVWWRLACRAAGAC